MKAPSEPSMPATSTELYSKACSRILDVLATTLNYLDWEATLCTVAKSFTDMAHLLNTANLVSYYCSLPLYGYLFRERYYL